MYYREVFIIIGVLTLQTSIITKFFKYLKIMSVHLVCRKEKLNSHRFVHIVPDANQIYNLISNDVKGLI